MTPVLDMAIEKRSQARNVVSFASQWRVSGEYQPRGRTVVPRMMLDGAACDPSYLHGPAVLRVGWCAPGTQLSECV